MNDEITKRLKIAHFGAFDHDSYGDLLFPLIIESFLPEFDIVHISPTGTPTLWSDAKQTMSIAEAISKDDWDGVLVGGGDIIQSSEWGIDKWYSTNYLSFSGLASIWAGASILSAKLGIPCVWNSPGVPKDIPEDMSDLVTRILKSVEYIAVRDKYSAQRLAKLTSQYIEIVPDTAFGISDMWPSSENLVSRSELRPLVLSITPSDALNRWDEIEKLIDVCAKRSDFSGDVVLLPLMGWQSDSGTLSSTFIPISKHNIIIKDRTLSIKECAYEIANSLVYVGNSLHGLITAISYGVPGIVVKPLSYDASKYKGTAEHFDEVGRDLVADNFVHATDMLDRISNVDTFLIREKILAHFRHVVHIFQNMAISNKYEIWKDLRADSVNILDKMLLHGIDLPMLNIRQKSKLEQLLHLKQELSLQILNLKEELLVNEKELKELSEKHIKTIAELNEVFSSRSWILTKPLRHIRRTLAAWHIIFLRIKLSAAIHRAWRLLPLSISLKQRIKTILFKVAPFLFYKTQVYQNWRGNRRCVFNDLQIQQENEFTNADIHYVPLLRNEPLKEKPAKLICLYLPQFHPIPENNEWWGKGFTEWTNVKPAQPQFKGHYQPHVPGELGYYNLLEPKTQKRQVELAKIYGIEGFCFYFYWFAGKTLLEQPIRNYLENKELDLPFCLCWANENWSRRWDGLDNEILISQNYSSTDDLEFIKHVSEYMQDDRYIKIDGKPLLVLYRPNLLPDAKNTSIIWRRWCKENGIGEIFLAYTESFESVDPDVYGFDAAIEFPPNNMAPPLVTKKIPGRALTYEGQIYDWRVFPERSKSYQDSGYKLFRGVNPSWDNTARRKSRSTILYGSSPLGYQNWLSNAIKDTQSRFSNPDERIIFINAWNEWAEGAHLEPDQKYGYAYLEATRMALKKQLLISESESKANINNQTLAIVIHAFYSDIFEEIITSVELLKVKHKLYVTTIKELEDEIQTILRKSGYEYTLLVVPNHGRDVLPFLKILPYVKKAQHQILLKLHTKKSVHREDGQYWRADIFEKLLCPQHVTEIIRRLTSDNSLGLVGPAGHIHPMTFYWGSNKDRVIHLAARLGLDLSEVKSLKFIAGTMFYSSINALEPLIQLAIDDDDFEQENGQIDGTFAHAIERIISISAYVSKQKLMSTDGISLKEQKKVSDQNSQNYTYQFAD